VASTKPIAIPSVSIHRSIIAQPAQAQVREGTDAEAKLWAGAEVDTGEGEEIRSERQQMSDYIHIHTHIYIHIYTDMKAFTHILLPTAYLLHTYYLLTTYLLPTYYLPTTYLLSTYYLLPTYYQPTNTTSTNTLHQQINQLPTHPPNQPINTPHHPTSRPPNQPINQSPTHPPTHPTNPCSGRSSRPGHSRDTPTVRIRRATGPPRRSTDGPRRCPARHTAQAPAHARALA
jgi:hypothetical protein